MSEAMGGTSEMGIIGANWTWTMKRERAALLFAEGVTAANIAAELQMPQVTLNSWKKVPQFKARIDELVEEYRQVILGRGIARLENRVARLDRDWQRMESIKTQRAAQYGNEGPGTDTGLVIHRERIIGRGEDAERVIEYEVDTNLLREQRAHEEQAAKELGQWEDRSSLNLNGSVKVVAYHVVMPNAEGEQTDDEIMAQEAAEIRAAEAERFQPIVDIDGTDNEPSGMGA